MTTKAPSAIDHDDEWLADNDPEESIVGVDNIVAFSSWEDIQLYAKQYAEHLTAKLQADNDALREALQESHELAHQYNCDYLSAMGSCGAVLEPHPLLEQSS